MKRTLLTTTAAFALFGSAAVAQLTGEQVVESLLSQGFEDIEVDVGPTQIKAEVRAGADKVEVIYDRETGEIIEQEVYTGAGDDVDPGVDVDVDERDYSDDDDDMDDDDDDDDDDGGSDDDDDDDSGSDDDDDDGSDGDDDDGGSDGGSDDDDD